MFRPLNTQSGGCWQFAASGSSFRLSVRVFARGVGRSLCLLDHLTRRVWPSMVSYCIARESKSKEEWLRVLAIFDFACLLRRSANTALFSSGERTQMEKVENM